MSAKASGTFDIGGDLTVNRLGFGAMRITGKGIWDEPEDRDEALRLLQEQPDIDLFLVDHSMPGISGFELVKLLRQQMRRSELIILGLSADAKGSLSALFIKHGADDFLRKPFCPEELNCRVMSTLERRDLLRALKQAAQFDSLTGLHNRRSFYDNACRQLQQAAVPVTASAHG